MSKHIIKRPVEHKFNYNIDEHCNKQEWYPFVCGSVHGGQVLNVFCNISFYKKLFALKFLVSNGKLHVKCTHCLIKKSEKIKQPMLLQQTRNVVAIFVEMNIAKFKKSTNRIMI